MLWYELAIPAAVTSLAVRLDAVFLGPYWSWLQLIPGGFVSPDPASTRRLRRQALARRIAIPGLVGFSLSLAWPGTYGPPQAALVTFSSSCLLLWPLVFSSDWRLIHHPRKLAVILYALLLVLFAASGYLGSLIASSITERGGFASFVRDEGIGVIFTAVIVLFVRGAMERIAGRMDPSTDEEPGW